MVMENSIKFIKSSVCEGKKKPESFRLSSLPSSTLSPNRLIPFNVVEWGWRNISDSLILFEGINNLIILNADAIAKHFSVAFLSFSPSLSLLFLHSLHSESEGAVPFFRGLSDSSIKHSENVQNWTNVWRDPAGRGILKV